MSEKILIYNKTFFQISETFIYHQVKALSDYFTVDLLLAKFENPHNYDVKEFDRHEIHLSRNFLTRISRKLFDTNLFDIKSTFKLSRLLRKNNIRAIHAHYGTNALDILPFAKLAGIPLVVSFHGADASRVLKDKMYVKKFPDLFDYASAIAISSKHMAGNLSLEKWKGKVHFIPYGVNPEDFDAQYPNEKSEKIKILHSGRIVNKKGVPDLVKVFKELSLKYEHIELHIIGNGEELPTTKELVSNLDIADKVKFYGAVPHEEVKRMLSLADIFVLNSRVADDGDMEGTPVSILEAMCMGKPVVSTRHAGIPYVIEHGKNGLLAKERSNEELRDCIEGLINDENQRKQLGREAKNTIETSYTTQIMRKKIREVFKNIIEINR